MKTKLNIFLVAVVLLLGSQIVFAQSRITIVTPANEVAEGLDLYAVADLFKHSRNLEEFEAALNDPDIGINNLDLDRDGYVDYIRVVEQVVNHRHVIILQVPFRPNEFQNIATIEIERTGYDDYRLQIRGVVRYYGPNYYFSFGYSRAYPWPIVTWIFSPFYRPYRSVVYFGYYPRWWQPYRHVTVYEYRHRNPGHSWREAFYRKRADRFAYRHDDRDRHFDNHRGDRPQDRHYAPPRPDRSPEYGNQPRAPREERRSDNPRMRNPEQNDNNRERNNFNRPDVRKNEDNRREARQSERPAGSRNSDSRGDESKTVRQRAERRSMGDQDNKSAPVREKRMASR